MLTASSVFRREIWEPILLPVCKDWNEDLVSGALTASPAITVVHSL